jgi:hypothetical protein
MKKNVILVMFIMCVFLVSSIPMSASTAADDYKIVKKAVKGKYSKGDISFFKIKVTDKKTGKSKVKVTIPMALVDILSECTDGDFKIEDKCHINLKKIMKILKKNGPMTLIEVDDEDELIKIWFE